MGKNKNMFCLLLLLKDCIKDKGSSVIDVFYKFNFTHHTTLFSRGASANFSLPFLFLSFNSTKLEVV